MEPQNMITIQFHNKKKKMGNKRQASYMLNYYIWQLHFPFLDLYSLAYISLRLVHLIHFLLNTKTQVFLHGIKSGCLNFFFPFLLLSQSRHYSHRIAHFFPVNTTVCSLFPTFASLKLKFQAIQR